DPAASDCARMVVSAALSPLAGLVVASGPLKDDVEAVVGVDDGFRCSATTSPSGRVHHPSNMSKLATDGKYLNRTTDLIASRNLMPRSGGRHEYPLSTERAWQNKVAKGFNTTD